MKQIHLIIAAITLFAISLFAAFSYGGGVMETGSILSNLVAPVEISPVIYTGLQSVVANSAAAVLNIFLNFANHNMGLAIIVLALMVELILLYSNTSLQLHQKQIHLFHKKLVDRFEKGELSYSKTQHELHLLYDVNQKLHSGSAILVAVQIAVFFSIFWGINLLTKAPYLVDGAWTMLSVSLLAKPANFVIPTLVALAYFLHSLIKIYIKQREDYISPQQTMMAIILAVITSTAVYFFSGMFATALTVYFVTLITFATLRYIYTEQHAKLWGEKARKDLMAMLSDAKTHKHKFEYISRKWNHLPIVRHLNFHLMEEAVSMTIGLLIALNFFGVLEQRQEANLNFAQVPSVNADIICSVAPPELPQDNACDDINDTCTASTCINTCLSNTVLCTNIMPTATVYDWSNGEHESYITDSVSIYGLKCLGGGCNDGFTTNSECCFEIPNVGKRLFKYKDGTGNTFQSSTWLTHSATNHSNQFQFVSPSSCQTSGEYPASGSEPYYGQNMNLIFKGGYTRNAVIFRNNNNYNCHLTALGGLPNLVNGKWQTQFYCDDPTEAGDLILRVDDYNAYSRQVAGFEKECTIHQTDINTRDFSVANSISSQKWSEGGGYEFQLTMGDTWTQDDLVWTKSNNIDFAYSCNGKKKCKINYKSTPPSTAEGTQAWVKVVDPRQTLYGFNDYSKTIDFTIYPPVEIDAEQNAIGVGQHYDFNVENNITGLEWSIVNDDGTKGSIDPATGYYNAPDTLDTDEDKNVTIKLKNPNTNHEDTLSFKVVDGPRLEFGCKKANGTNGTCQLNNNGLLYTADNPFIVIYPENIAEHTLSIEGEGAFIADGNEVKTYTWIPENLNPVGFVYNKTGITSPTTVHITIEETYTGQSNSIDATIDSVPITGIELVNRPITAGGGEYVFKPILESTWSNFDFTDLDAYPNIYEWSLVDDSVVDDITGNTGRYTSSNRIEDANSTIQIKVKDTFNPDNNSIIQSFTYTPETTCNEDFGLYSNFGLPLEDGRTVKVKNGKSYTFKVRNTLSGRYKLVSFGGQENTNGEDGNIIVNIQNKPIGEKLTLIVKDEFMEGIEGYYSDDSGHQCRRTLTLEVIDNTPPEDSSTDQTPKRIIITP